MGKKLYLFGIGGTGSRVIKAFAMLMAAGCKLDNRYDIVVPIIIDPDKSNGDLARTKDILKVYQQIRSQIHQPDDFFSVEIKTVNELANKTTSINPEYFQFELNDVDDKMFKDYIGFDTLSDRFAQSEDDKSFLRLLFSDNNLNSNLNVGFKGNPNMGSIVLDQFTNSEEFKKFALTFDQNDSIFIINSIFGGTGAAGFPLLLKNLRGNEDLPRHNYICKSIIGGITYLPYFSLDAQGEVNDQSFMEKAKIALDYYNRTIISNRQINVLYFLGNRGNSNLLGYAEGGKDQKNAAHFLEMAGGLAIMDFCKVSENSGQNTSIREFGILNDTENIHFNDLDDESRERLFEPLIKFRLFTQYLKKGLQKALNISRWTKGNIKFVGERRNSKLTSDYFDSPEYKNHVRIFIDYFDEWIDEMSESKPSFKPFKSVEAGDIGDFIEDKQKIKKLSFKAIDTENCKLIDNPIYNPDSKKKHTTLIKLFAGSTSNVLKACGTIK